nr:MMPL family transporter [Desulfosarcina cetonica]
MKRISFDAYLKRVTQTPYWALAGCVLITLFLAWQLPGLSFKTTIYDLVIEDLNEAARYRQFLARFGGDEIIRIVVKADNVFDPATFAKISQLSAAAAKIDGVIRILSLPEVKQAVDRGNRWDMTEFARMLAPVTLFQRNLISADRKTTIITLVLDAAADKGAAVVAVKNLLQNAGKDLRLYQTGMPLVSEALADYARQDFLHLPPVTLLVIGLLLLVLFRNLHCRVLPLGCVILSVVWTLGAMALSDISVSMLTIIVPVFLIAVGTAYCLHVASEYRQQIRLCPTARAATLATFRQMSLPVSLAVGTTLIGLASLAVNPITAIQEFAGFACFGMVSLLVIVLTFFPAMLVLLPPPRTPDAADSRIDRFFERLLAGIVAINRQYRRPALITIGIIALVCVAGMLRLRVETNPVAFFKANTDVSRHFHDIYQEMSGSFPINVVISGSEADYYESPDNVAAIARLQTVLDRLPGVDKTISLADYLMLVNYVDNRFDPAYYTLPKDNYELRMLMNNFKIILGNDLLQRFMSADYNRTNILMLTHIANSHDFLETRQAILAQAPGIIGDAASLEVIGLGVVIAASSDLLTRGQVKSLGISLILIFGVMVVLFLSGKVGLIAWCRTFFRSWSISASWVFWAFPFRWPPASSPAWPSAWPWTTRSITWCATTPNSKRTWTRTGPCATP